MKNLGHSSYGEKAKDIWAFDYETLDPYLRKLDYTNYRACEATDSFLKKLNLHEIDYDKSLHEIATNKLFKLNKLLTKRIEKDDWQEEDSLKRQELLAYFRDYQHEDYIELFNDIENLRILNDKNSYFFPLSTIISGIISKNCGLFVDVLIRYIENFSNSLWSNAILNNYFSSSPTNHQILFNRLAKSNAARAKVWLLEYHGQVPLEYLDVTNNEMLLNFYDVLSSLNKMTLSRINSIVEKYKIYESEEIICHKLVDILVKNKDLFIDEESLEYILNMTNDYLNCQTLYIKSKEGKTDRLYFDYKQKLFLQLIKLDNTFLIRYLDFLFSISPSDRHEAEEFNKIWQLECSEKVVSIGLDYFVEKRRDYYGTRDASTNFFSQLGGNYDKALAFVEKTIKERYNDIEYMQIIFDIISRCFTDNRCQLMKSFLLLNQNFEFFQKLDLFPNSMSAWGSWIPVYERRIKDLENILSTIKSLDMGIKLLCHIKDIEDEILSYKRSIKQEAKRDFLREFDSY